MDHSLHQLGLAVPCAANDVAVLEPSLFRYVERDRKLQHGEEWSAREIQPREFRRTLALLGLWRNEAL